MFNKALKDLSDLVRATERSLKYYRDLQLEDQRALNAAKLTGKLSGAVISETRLNQLQLRMADRAHKITLDEKRLSDLESQVDALPDHECDNFYRELYSMQKDTTIPRKFRPYHVDVEGGIMWSVNGEAINFRNILRSRAERAEMAERRRQEKMERKAKGKVKTQEKRT